MKLFSNLCHRTSFLVVLLLAATVSLNAQGDPGTDDDPFFVQITTSGGSLSLLLENTFQDCGWVGSTYGPSVTEEICGELVWVGPDSLACTPLTPGSLTNKFAFIRRGACDFSAKVFEAQKAGAKAVVVTNHYNNATDGPCVAYIGTQFFGGMSGATNADSVQIPSVFIQRQTGEQIDAALKAGETVTACFVFPRLTASYAEYHHATPVTQVQELTGLSFNFINREPAPITNMAVTAEITEPNGNVVTITNTIPEIGIGADTLIFFEGYTPAAELGEFKVKFYTDRYTEPRDTLHRSFVHTDYTFATDNLTLRLDGGADRNDLFITDLQYQVGSLAVTGDNGGVATYCTFGIANIDSVYVPGNPIANTLNVFLYKADSDGNGLIDLDSDFSDMEIVGLSTYEMKGTEKEDILLDVEILDINTNLPGVTLEPNNLYYISVQYDGLENGSGRNCAFSNSANVPYLSYANEAGSFVPTAPIKLGGTLSFWGDRTVACRLQLEGYEPTMVGVNPNLLDADKYSVSPNPANEFLMIDLALEQQSDVAITITNPMGQRLHTEVLKNVQNGRVSMDVQKIPSGTYMMIIRTEEGIGVKKVMICH